MRNGEITQRSIYDDWQKVSVSQTDLNKKVDKVKGKGLINNEINIIVKNIIGDTDDLFDGVIIADFDPTTHIGSIDGSSENGIFKVVDTKGNFIGILERQYDEDPGIDEYYYIVCEFFEDLNGVVWAFIDEDGGGYHDPWEPVTWYKINLKDKFFAFNVSGEYVTKEEFDATIGDIQSLLDNTISLADSYIGEVTE